MSRFLSSESSASTDTTVSVVAAGSLQPYRDRERRRVLHFRRAEMSVTCVAEMWMWMTVMRMKMM